MVEKYKHNKYNILMRKFLFIFWSKNKMCIFLSPLHNYYLKKLYFFVLKITMYIKIYVNGSSASGISSKHYIDEWC